MSDPVIISGATSVIDPIILSDTNPDLARSVFNQWMNDEPVTLLVVTGTGATADLAVSKASEMINSNYKFYHSSRVVHAKQPADILDILKGLKVNPEFEPINWNRINDIILLAVSMEFNNIGIVVFRSEFTDLPPLAWIIESIKMAQSNDKLLS